MVKLIIFELSTDPRKTYGNTQLPSPNRDDITLFFMKSTTTSTANRFGIHYTGEDTYEDYTSKRKSETILNTTTTIDDDDVDKIERVAANYEVWNTIVGNDIGASVRMIITEIMAQTEDAISTKPNLETINTLFTAGGNYQGVIVDADGNLSPVERQTYTPPIAGVPGAPTPAPAPTVVPPPAATTGPDFGATAKGDILTMIDLVIPAIKYDGFNPKKIRKAFLNKSPNDDIIVKNLFMVFAGYIHAGNNKGKLETRRVNNTIGKAVINAIETLGVRKTDRSATGLTLPRLAIAFMPEYLVFRMQLAGELQNQTESSVHVHYKDIVFYGCKDIREKSGYEEFHKEFSSYIYNKGKGVDPSDEKFLKDLKMWRKVSVTGYNSDSAIHPRMTTALDGTISSKNAAYDFINQGVAVYRAEP